MKYLIWTFFLILAAGISGFIHESGHFLVGWFFDWNPEMSFQNGGRVDYQNLPITVEDWKDFLALIAGPSLTFLTALISISLINKSPKSMLFFSFGYWNSVFRLSAIIDGQGSDEYKISQLLGIPYLFQLLSIVFCLYLSFKFLSKQKLIPNSLGLVPILFILCAATYKISFGLLSAL